ncbi:hypothetical protein [Burkholderia cepacia]|uniref:hypothetical protein n=1 Tax=Burkholderia cepacia TaxID=292 RepID=UPI002FDFFEB1
MAAKYHHIREEIDGYTVAGTITEHNANCWSIEFEVVRDGRVVIPLTEDKTRTYLTYTEAADAIERKARDRIAGAG